MIMWSGREGDAGISPPEAMYWTAARPISRSRAWGSRDKIIEGEGCGTRIEEVLEHDSDQRRLIRWTEFSSVGTSREKRWGGPDLEVG